METTMMECVDSGWTWQWMKTACMFCQRTLTTLCLRKVSRCVNSCRRCWLHPEVGSMGAAQSE